MDELTKLANRHGTDKERKQWLKKAKQGLRKCPGHKGYNDCYDENHRCLKCGGYKRGEWYLVDEDEDYTYHYCL